MTSIQSRLASGLLLVLVIILVIQWIIIGASIRNLGEQYIVSRLKQDSDALAGGLKVSEMSKPVLDEKRIPPVYLKAFSGHYFSILSGEVQVRSRSLWDEQIPTLEVAIGDFKQHRSAGPLGQVLLLLSASYSKKNLKFSITVAEDISVFDMRINRFLILHGIVSAIVLFLLTALQVVIIRYSLKPLDRLRKDIEKLESGLIDSLEEDVPTELKPLVQELNVRIKTLRTRLERFRYATGNLAHALKHPLTLLVQLSSHDSVKNNSSIRDIILKETQNIQNIIDRELKRARMAGSILGGRQANIALEIKALVGTLLMMYRDKQLSIEYKIAEKCISQIDREDLLEMLGNVADNACKWAQKKVQIRVENEGGLMFCIEDDGPGVAFEDRSKLLSRGTRLDENKEGHGLGLAITKDIVEQYGGKMLLEQSSELGGLKVQISFMRD